MYAVISTGGKQYRVQPGETVHVEKLELPEGEKKPTYLLSSAYRLTVAEKRWVEEHRATVTKLGTFHPGRNFAPLQTRMVRQQKPAGEQQ